MNRKILMPWAMAYLRDMVGDESDEFAFDWGNTPGEDGGYGKERFEFLIQAGYVLRTGLERKNQLGGVWPEAKITAHGRGALESWCAVNEDIALKRLASGEIMVRGVYPFNDQYVFENEVGGVPVAIVSQRTMKRWIDKGEVVIIKDGRFEESRKYGKKDAVSRSIVLGSDEWKNRFEEFLKGVTERGGSPEIYQTVMNKLLEGKPLDVRTLRNLVHNGDVAGSHMSEVGFVKREVELYKVGAMVRGGTTWYEVAPELPQAQVSAEEDRPRSTRPRL